MPVGQGFQFGDPLVKRWFVGEALGQALAAEGKANKRVLETELRELRIEVARLENLLNSLREITASDHC